MTVRRGTDFLSSGSDAAPGAVERVRKAHLNTKIMLRIRPSGEMIDGHTWCRRRKWSPQESDWKSNSKHVGDMTELCRLKLDSKRTPTPVTKATWKGRRDIDDNLEQHDVQASRRFINRSIINTVYSVRRVSGRDLGCTSTRQTRERRMCTKGQQKN